MPKKNSYLYTARLWNPDLMRIESHQVDKRIKEYYYTTSKLSFKNDPFIEHISDFLAGIRTVPVTKAPSIQSDNLFFTFSIEMYQEFLTDIQKIRKPYECACKYGFKGYSIGGQNGIHLIRRQDGQLLKGLECLIENCAEEISYDLNCKPQDIQKLSRIKIVCHNPLGERVVGLMNKINSRAIFLGFGRYR